MPPHIPGRDGIYLILSIFHAKSNCLSAGSTFLRKRLVLTSLLIIFRLFFIWNTDAGGDTDFHG